MNLVVEGNLKRRFKSACVLDGTSMSDVVSELVSDWLEERETRQKAQDTQDNKTRQKKSRKADGSE